MTPATHPAAGLSRRAMVLGTVFLVFQLLFALNNYGPQRVPLLRLVFDEPFVAPHRAAAAIGTGTMQFTDMTQRAGLSSYRRPLFNDDVPRYAEVMGGGVAVADVDGDGWEDLFFTSLPSFDPGSPSVPSALFRNNGDETFENVTQKAGLVGLRGLVQGALFFDYDNDGDPDLYVAAYDGGQLFRNEGGTFRDATAEAGLLLDGRCGELPCFGSSATAADYDRDGHLDLLVVNNVYWDADDPDQIGRRQLFPAFFPAQPAFLFRNRGDGTFADVTEATGLTNAGGKGLGAVWTDLNRDGWPDVYIANDLSPNRLYVNRGDGTFAEFAESAGLDEIKSSMGVTAADFDHDGEMELVTTNLKGSKVSLFRNMGGLRFDYATDYSGLASSARASGWGIEAVDVDLDGHLDLAVSGGPVWEKTPTDTRNLLFRNTGQGRFEDVTLTSGAIQAGTVARGLAVADINRDGQPDLVFANADGESPLLLCNESPSPNGWLRLHLEGTASNRDAVGARVELLRADGLRIVQEVRAGGSYQSTSTRALFFGLGDSAPAELKIHWPSGAVETYTDLQANAILQVQEGSGTDAGAAG